jgi:hypothetical protein
MEATSAALTRPSGRATRFGSPFNPQHLWKALETCLQGKIGTEYGASMCHGAPFKVT